MANVCVVFSMQHKCIHQTHTIHTHTHQKVENKGFFINVGWGSPTKTLFPPWEHKEYRLFCYDGMALPTTAMAKEREGKPGDSQQPSIDAAYKNKATYFCHVYKNIVCALSWCLPKCYLQTQRTADVLYLNELSSMIILCCEYPWMHAQFILNCKYPMCADCV